MTARIRLFLLLALLIGLVTAPAAHAQWASLRADEPYGLSYRGLSSLSELLELDAPTHELLVALHLDMLLAENAVRQRAVEELERREQGGEEIRWRQRVTTTIDLTDEMNRIADHFFEDVSLIVDASRVPLVEHMHRRSRMARWFSVAGRDVSGLGAMPLELIESRKLVERDRLRELILEHAEAEARVWAQFNRTYIAIMELQKTAREFNFDFESINAEQIARTSRLFRNSVDQVDRLRSANESLADRVMESLDDEQRAEFETAWWQANYAAVQRERFPERVVSRVLEDSEASDELRDAVTGIRSAFADRMRVARRMARTAKHRSDLNFDFNTLLSGGRPDTSLYDSSLERINGIADSFTAALRGVMTPEQQQRYGLADE